MGCSAVFGLDIIDHQNVCVADIEVAVDDNGMCPAGVAHTLAFGERKGTLQIVSARIGLDKCHDVVLVAEVQVAVGVKHGSRATTRLVLLPHYLSGLHFDAGRLALAVVVAAVDIVADSDEAAVMVLKSAGIEEVNLFSADPDPCRRGGVDTISYSSQLEQCAAGAVSGRTEYVFTVNDRGRNISGPVCNFVVSPEEAAVFCGDTYQSLVRQLDVLADAAGLGDDDGGIARLVLSSSTDVGHRRFPNKFSGLLIERDDDGAAAAGCA